MPAPGFNDPLTDGERARIKQLLGASDLFAQSAGRPLVEALNAIDTKPDSRKLIRDEIAFCDQIDTAMRGGAINRLKASVVGPITLNPNEIPKLRGLGRQAVRRIAATLGVPIYSDAFGAGTIAGDNRMRVG